MVGLVVIPTLCGWFGGNTHFVWVIWWKYTRCVVGLVVIYTQGGRRVPTAFSRLNIVLRFNMFLELECNESSLLLKRTNNSRILISDCSVVQQCHLTRVKIN